MQPTPLTKSAFGSPPSTLSVDVLQGCSLLQNLANLHGGEDEAVSDEVRRVADALGRLEAVEVGLLALDVDGVERVEAEPRREGEPALVRQLRDRRQDDRLQTEETVVHFDGRQHPFWTAVRTAFGVGSGKQVSHSDVMDVLPDVILRDN